MNAVAKILLDIKAVTVNVQDPYTYSSGMRSPIYCDNRLLLSYPKERRIVRDAYIALIKKNNIYSDIIGGTATAGIPHAAWIAEELEKPMVYIRGEAKGHGKGKRIEGELKKGDSVLVVEDLISTGASSLEALKSVQEEGGKADTCIAIFTYGLAVATAAFKKTGVMLYTITNLNELLEVAESEKYILPTEKEKVLDWVHDPEGWGMRHGLTVV